VQTDLFGRVLREIQLPNNIDAGRRRDAIGGTCGRRDRRWAHPQQRLRGPHLVGRRPLPVRVRSSAASTGGATHTRIARYDLEQIRSGSAPSNGLRFGGDWQFFYYPLEAATGAGFIGFSEIINTGDGTFLVIERDQGIGAETRG
jgi:hypothetical protein